MKPPRQPRNRNNCFPKDPKVDLPPFYGKENVEEYLNWEMKEKRVTLATLSFYGSALTWWTTIIRDLTDSILE